MKSEIEKLAKIMRTEPEVVEQVALKMEKITGKKEVIEKLLADIEGKVAEKLDELNLTKPNAEQVYNALLERLKKHDQKLFEYFKYPDFSKTEGYQTVLNFIKEMAGDLTGFYLKREPALELFRKNPPLRIMYALKYNNLEKMLEQEDWLELFAALRIVEDPKWVNQTFFAPYKDIKPEDFEQRQIKVLAMPKRWSAIAESFEEKKLHHMSHLKEIGLVFTVPMGGMGLSGEMIYLIFMTLHYLHEVDWHSKLFRLYSSEPNFSEKMINALKVEVSSESLPINDKMNFRIVPSYLGKHDLADKRLKEPRVSPEDWHYIQTVKDIKKFAGKNPETELDFWNDLYYVANYFSNKDSQELVSFNLFDAGVALLKKAGFESKYIYHQIDALWNELVIRYIGEEKLNQLLMENLDKGFISL